MRYVKLPVSLLILTILLCLITGFAAAEDDSWMPENYATLRPAPKERIITGLPKGLSAQCSVSDGRIEYVIDTEKTDWESVLAYTYQASSGQTYISPGIRMPDGAAQQRTMGYSVDMGNPELKIVQRLKEDFAQHSGHRSDAANNYWIGRYDESTATYVPLERLGLPQGIATLWYNDSGELLYGEYVHFTIDYTDADAFAVHMSRVPESDITPNVPALVTEYGTTLLSSKDDGMIRYEVSQPEQLTSFSVTTAIAAPAIDGKDVSAWTCYLRSANNSSFSPCQMADAGQYGLNRRSALIQTNLQNYAYTDQKSYILEWRDELGVTQYVAQFSTLSVCGTPAPWPIYSSWKPIPRSRLGLQYVNQIASGTNLTYDETTGVAYFHIDPNELPETAAYGGASMLMDLTPPEGATAYSFFNGNSDTAFGENSYMAQHVQSWMEMNGRHLCSEGFSIGQPLFNTHRQESSDLTLYMYAMMPSKFAAEYTIVNWYRDIHDAQPMSTEFVFRQMDNCIRMDVSTPYGSEDDLPDRITSSAIVIPNDNSAAQKEFIAQIYPQDGETSRYYELHLLDKNGRMAHLPAHSKIILPYPEGTSFDNLTISFSLRHLNNKYQTFEIFSEADGTLHREENYLWFVPNSLSPFVLEWAERTDAAQAADLPKTGDSSHPFAALAVFLTAGAALYVQLKRRKI